MDLKKEIMMIDCYFKLGNELIKNITQLKIICNDSLKK